MTQRPLSTLATAFGILAVLFVVLPWYSVHVNGGEGEVFAGPASSENGLWDRYMGVYILPLAAVGTLAMAWFAMKRTKPGLSKCLLLTAAVGFAGAAALTLRDMLCGLPAEVVTMRSAGLVAGKAIGLYMTFGALIGALLITLVTMLSSRTAYRD